MNIEIVNLEADALTYIAEIARRRQDNKRNRDVDSHKWTTHKTEFACDYEGVLTEWAAATVLGLEMAELEKVFPRGDGGIDFHWGKYSCDAKKLSFTNMGECLIMTPPAPKADILIGCRIKSPTCVEIVGVVSSKQFMKDKQEHNFGYGDRYYIQADSLSPIEKLRSL